LPGEIVRARGNDHDGKGSRRVRGSCSGPGEGSPRHSPNPETVFRGHGKGEGMRRRKKRRPGFLPLGRSTMPVTLAREEGRKTKHPEGIAHVSKAVSRLCGPRKQWKIKGGDAGSENARRRSIGAVGLGKLSFWCGPQGVKNSHRRGDLES